MPTQTTAAPADAPDAALTTKGSWATWAMRAECREEDPEAFFPDESDRPAVAAAVAVCARCPVRHECLDYAMGAREDGGIWGGLTATERDALRRSAGRTAQRRRQRSTS